MSGAIERGESMIDGVSEVGQRVGQRAIEVEEDGAECLSHTGILPEALPVGDF